MNNLKEVTNILIKAMNWERWVPKSDQMYPFLEPEELKEMADSVIKELKLNGYKIVKVKNK